MVSRALAIVLLLAAMFAANCRSSSPELDYPGYDLLVITLDTTRADRIGAYGYAAARTPGIDELAAQGVRFDEAFAPSSTTLPSHASLFTGLYPPSHGARTNGSFALDPEHATLAELLAREGYQTAAFIGAFPLDSRFGLDRGFELYDDTLTPRERSNKPHYAERNAVEVTAAALSWLRESARPGAPLFMWVHYFDPHAPYRPPQPPQGYDGEIAFVDSQVTRLLRAVDEVRGLQRTLIVLAADHGESLGEHGEETHAMFVYDATLRIPLVLANPVLVGEGRTVGDRIVSLVDVFPTVLDLLEVGLPAEVDGEHLLAGPSKGNRAVYFETVEPLVSFGWAPLRGLRTLEDKLIEAPQMEYYLVHNDPAEEHNLFSGSVGAARLQQRLLAQFGELDPADLLPRVDEADPEVTDKLAALGYVRTRSTGRLPEVLRDPKQMLPLWNGVDEFFDLAEMQLFDEALIVIDGIVEGDPGNGQAWFYRGVLLQGMGRLAEAEASVLRSVRLFPSSASYARLAEILFLQDKFDEGDAAVEEARRLDPQSGLPYIAQGVGAALRHRYEEALRALDRAKAIDPANTATWADEFAVHIERMRDQKY
jgi:arylsulfatase A-like enzyme